MRYFVALPDLEKRGFPGALLKAYEALPRSRGFEYRWRHFRNVAVLEAWDNPWGEDLIAHNRGDLAIGVVRLDQREQVERVLGLRNSRLTDLELVLRLVTQLGASVVSKVLGDFSFVVQCSPDGPTIAATDALGIKKLFYVERDGFVAFASRAEALAVEDHYDPQYLVELIARCLPTPGLTAYRGVHRLPSGTIATIGRSRLALSRYWTPEEVATERHRKGFAREAPERLQALLTESIRARLSDGHTWAHLSGGLDSSSVVSTTQWLAQRGEVPHGLAGTVTYVDWQGTMADEREYSDAVASYWHIRNITIVDPPFWLDADAVPPNLDQPGDVLAFYPREQRLAAAVAASGGRVLLAGSGSDELLSGTTLFLADWLARGRLWATARELARWAAIGRVSFWELGWGNALRPLIPRPLRRSSSIQEGLLLPWIPASAVRRYGLAQRTFSVTGTGRWGHKYRDTMVAGINALMSSLNAGVVGDVLDVRYPFLSLPLVEFALQLPPECCVQPQRRKWVLREAMRGILPEFVRSRVGKGGSTDLLVRSLTAQRDLLEPLVRAPILAELGVVDASKLRNAFERTQHRMTGEQEVSTDLQTTLMVEAWLRMRSGRWLQGEGTAQRAVASK